jgi:hypothetical protein
VSKSIILNNAYVTPSQPIGQVGLKKDNNQSVLVDILSKNPDKDGRKMVK